MARPRKCSVTATDNEIKQAVALTKDMLPKEEEVDIDQMPLNSLGDYMRYNKKATALNKKLKICRYPIKQCPVELHPHERIQFGRNDQPDNFLPVFLSNDMIHYENKLYPGKIYDIPRCVVEYLSKKGNPIWKWFTLSDGSKETRIDSYTPRFALRTIYKD